MLAAVSWRARPRLARLTGNLGRAEFVQKLKADMAAALEGAEYVQASAAQAYLECDPAERQPGDVYTERYTRMAKVDIDAALQGFEALQNELGSRGAAEDALRDGQALLTLADTLLTRDRLAAQLEKLSEKQQARAGGGAKRAADSGVLRAAEKEQLPGGEEGGARSSRR